MKLESLERLKPETLRIWKKLLRKQCCICQAGVIKVPASTHSSLPYTVDHSLSKRLPANVPNSPKTTDRCGPSTTGWLSSTPPRSPLRVSRWHRCVFLSHTHRANVYIAAPTDIKLPMIT